MADKELHAHFSPNKPLEPDVLSELQSILRLHDLSAEDLFFKWESYCIKLDIDAQAVSLSAIRSLKQTIQDALEKTTQRAQPRVVGTPRPGANRAGGADVFGVLDGLLPSTPMSGARLAHRGSGMKKKLETPKFMGSSPVTSGMGDQLKAMNMTTS